MGGQLHAVGGVVARYMGNHNHLALGLGHDILQHHLALSHALVDALPGGAAHIEAIDALFDEVAGQRPDPFGGDVARLVIAGVERGNDALVLCFVQKKHLTDWHDAKICFYFP